MELKSQQADVLKILHSFEIPLDESHFLSTSRLKWLQDPANRISGWKWPYQGIAIEEPETEYFFTAFKKKPNNNRWHFIYRPTGQEPIATSGIVDSFSQAPVAVWARALHRELSSPGRNLKLPGLPEAPRVLSFQERDILVEKLRQSGCPMDLLSWSPHGAAGVAIGVDTDDFYFKFNRGWDGTFAPGDDERRSSFQGDFNALLKHLEIWAKSWLRERGVIMPTLPTPASKTRERFIVKQISLRNIRQFRDLQVTIPDNNVVLFCGCNGTGKSTILRCISLALCHEADTAALLAETPGGFLRPETHHGEIEILGEWSSGQSGRYFVEIKRINEREALGEQDKQIENFVCGYGSVFNAVGQQDRAEYTVRDAVFSLFNYGTKLFSLELVLRRLNDKLKENYNESIAKLCAALGFPTSVIELTADGVQVLDHGVVVPFAGWADGYRITTSWLVDIFGWAMLAEALDTAGTGIHGIVLVDEVDKHLHPSMQANIVPRLVNTLPNVQLFLTTHSPLTALGTKPGQLFVLNRNDDGNIEANLSSDIRGLSVEDVYTDPSLFHTEPFSPEVVKALHEHRRLADIPKAKRTPAQRQALAELANKLLGLGLL